MIARAQNMRGSHLTLNRLSKLKQLSDLGLNWLLVTIHLAVSGKNQTKCGLF